MRSLHSHKRRLLFAIAGLLLSTWAVVAFQTRQVSDASLKNSGKTGEEWLTVGLNYAEQRYSPLKQIDATNVNRLGLAWTMSWATGAAASRRPRWLRMA